MNNADANLAALLLDRLDVSPDDDARVDQITEIVRGLAADRRAQAAELARLSAALSVALAQLEEERARNAARQEPVAWMFKVGSRTEFTTNPNKAKLAQALGYGPQALAFIPGDAS